MKTAMYLLTRNAYYGYETTESSVVVAAATEEALREYVAALGYTEWQDQVCVISVQDDGYGQVVGEEYYEITSVVLL